MNASEYTEYTLMILDPEFSPAAEQAAEQAEEAREAAGHCAEWHEHEHTVPSVEIQAEQLLETAGSPELAKHAIDLAAHKH